MGPLLANNPHNQQSSKENYSTYSSTTSALPLAIPSHSSPDSHHVDHFIADLLQAVTDDIPLCSSCEEGIPASSRCRDCSEMLCDPCVRAHLRVRITKDHQIVRFTNGSNTISANTGSLGSSSQTSNSPCSSTGQAYSSALSNTICSSSNSSTSTYNSSSSTSNSNSTNSTNSAVGHYLCPLHHEPHRLYCETCLVAACTECTLLEHRAHQLVYIQDAAESAREHTQRLSAETRAAVGVVREAMDAVQRMAEDGEVRACQAGVDVRQLVKRYISSLEDRERELLNRIEQHKHMRSKLLHSHMENLRMALAKLARTSDILNESLETGTGLELIIANEKAAGELKQLRNIRADLLTAAGDDDHIVFMPPDSNLLRAVSSMGNITTTSNDTLLLHTRLQDNLCSTPSIFTAPIELKPGNQLAGGILLGGLGLAAAGKSPPGSAPISATANEMRLLRTGGVIGGGGLSPPTRGRPIHGSTVPVVVREQQQGYQSTTHSLLSNVSNGSPKFELNNGNNGLSSGSFSFGSEGELDGQLCRPWGVCCDKTGCIIVADRSNNRVQVFHATGVFSHKFGVQGTGPGQFDRPAGVAVDPQNRIVVADKDNHRIQLFTLEGNYVLMFGEKGSRNGQFNYPWDVAVNSQGHIIVSDTRNHRVQLFTNEGMFINKYGFEGSANMWKHFDSPRGVAFNPNGSVLITDFNNHRLVVIDQNLQHAQFLGQEGSGFKQFLRPQGIVCDDEGRIIVADSRNNRIQVFESNGTFLWKLGQAGKGPGELDRPSGICVNPDGRIVVVDFGNNRVQIF